jgi:hypothetical protein
MGILGSEPSLRSDMACITPWITSRNTVSPYRPVLEHYTRPSTCQEARTVSTKTTRAILVSGVTTSQSVASVLNFLRKK